jgi:hypothetical protein
MFGFNSGAAIIDCIIDSALFGFLKVELILSPEFILLEVRNRSF